MSIRPTRRAFAAGGIILSLTVACANRADATASDPDAMSIGAETAPLQLEEYASAACSHCAHFHQTNWAHLKRDYIDTGRLRLTMREILTQPAPIAFAMFQLARCGGADGPEYFRRLAILFERQRTILSSGTVGAAVASLVATGAEWGLTEAQVMASLRDQTGEDRVIRSINAADALGINATPTFVLNGQRIGVEFQTPEGMTRILDAALAR
jgi:protein-disulfide isomerase